MKITIKDEETKKLGIPNFTVLNKKVIKSLLYKANVEVDDELINIFLKSLKTAIKEVGHFTLLEVIDADGKGVKIDI